MHDDHQPPWTAVTAPVADAHSARRRDAPLVGDRYRTVNDSTWVVEAVGTAFILVRTPEIPGPGGVAALHRPGWRDTIARSTPLAPQGVQIEREDA